MAALRPSRSGEAQPPDSAYATYMPRRSPGQGGGSPPRQGRQQQQERPRWDRSPPGAGAGGGSPARRQQLQQQHQQARAQWDTSSPGVRGGGGSPARRQQQQQQRQARAQWNTSPPGVRGGGGSPARRQLGRAQWDASPSPPPQDGFSRGMAQLRRRQHSPGHGDPGSPQAAHRRWREQSAGRADAGGQYRARSPVRPPESVLVLGPVAGREGELRYPRDRQAVRVASPFGGQPPDGSFDGGLMSPGGGCPPRAPTMAELRDVLVSSLHQLRMDIDEISMEHEQMAREIQCASVPPMDLTSLRALNDERPPNKMSPRKSGKPAR
ncbi:hypothetical protein DIPPA_33089 [Diplonema papillatum]|nr:hypothetical protein DIPPA_33089 [Diplonema papillatum]